MAIEPIAHVRTLALIELVFVYAVSQRIFREKITLREITGMGMLAAGAPAASRQLAAGATDAAAPARLAAGPDAATVAAAAAAAEQAKTGDAALIAEIERLSGIPPRS